MPARLVICPVDVEVGADGVTRRTPRVSSIPDPGKPPFMCVFSAALSDGLPGQENDFCFCLVAAIDLSAVDADSEVISLFEVGDDQQLNSIQTWLTNTPKSLGWKAGKINKIKGKLNKRGVTTSDLSEDTALSEFANRIGRKFATPTWDIKNTMTTRVGA